MCAVLTHSTCIEVYDVAVTLILILARHRMLLCKSYCLNSFIMYIDACAILVEVHFAIQYEPQYIDNLYIREYEEGKKY
jgi:hypothetical protein